jgi:hypothetical protein
MTPLPGSAPRSRHCGLILVPDGAARRRAPKPAHMRVKNGLEDLIQ